MKRQRQLTAKQLAVIADLVAGELDDREILARHRVSAATLSRWATEPGFLMELSRQANWLCRRSELLLASYRKLAATRLIELTNCENPETARKACLDVIKISPASYRSGDADGGAAGSSRQQGDEQSAPEPGGQAKRLSPRQASRLLAALARQCDDDGDGDSDEAA